LAARKCPSCPRRCQRPCAPRSPLCADRRVYRRLDCCVEYKPLFCVPCARISTRRSRLLPTSVPPLPRRPAITSIGSSLSETTSFPNSTPTEAAFIREIEVAMGDEIRLSVPKVIAAPFLFFGSIKIDLSHLYDLATELQIINALIKQTYLQNQPALAASVPQVTARHCTPE